MAKKVEARKREHNRKQLNQRLSNLGYNLSLTEYKNPSVWHRQSWARWLYTWYSFLFVGFSFKRLVSIPGQCLSTPTLRM